MPTKLGCWIKHYVRMYASGMTGEDLEFRARGSPWYCII